MWGDYPSVRDRVTGPKPRVEGGVRSTGSMSKSDVNASMRREEGGEDWNGSAREQSGEREEERGLVLVWPPNSTTTFIK